MTEHLVPYRVLIIDDNEGRSSFGKITKAMLDEHEFEASHVVSWLEAERSLATTDYDFFLIDVNLQGNEDGRAVLAELRRRGFNQPIVLMTANDECLEWPVKDYASALSSGPVSFVNKHEVDFVTVARDVSNRVDSLRRSVRLMREAGLGDEVILVNNQTVRVADLLRSSALDGDVLRALRESLNVLLLRMIGQAGR